MHQLTIALAIQVVLVIFAPPIRFVMRSIIISDLWMMFWVAITALQTLFLKPNPDRKKIALKLVVPAIIVFAIYLHGILRPDLKSKLITSGIALSNEWTDQFDAKREFIIAIRFLSWIYAGILITTWHKYIKIRIDFLQKTLAICLSVAVFIMISVKFYPPLALQLGQIYQYDPNHYQWLNRIYGVFRSPIEASLVFGFSFLLLLPNEWAKIKLKSIVFILLLIGITLSQTITPIVSCAMIAAILLFLEFYKTKTKQTLIASAIITPALFTTLTFALKYSSFFQEKLGTLSGRIAPWKTLWDQALSRLDYLILGLGFSQYHVDNIYLFLLNRGGLVLSIFIYVLFLKYIFKSWSSWSWQQKAIALFPWISGLTVDSLIIRPLAMIFISVGLPILTKENKLSIK